MRNGLPAVMRFEETDIAIIDREGKPWVTAADLGRALGYADPARSVNRLFARSKDEFSDTLVGVVNLTTPGGTQKIRIFSARGCHLIGMLSDAPKAPAFRRWVLDVLEHVADRIGASDTKEDVLSFISNPQEHVREKLGCPRSESARRLAAMELNAASRAVGVVVKLRGSREAAKALDAIYAKVGVTMPAWEGPAQHELDLRMPEPRRADPKMDDLVARIDAHIQTKDDTTSREIVAELGLIPGQYETKRGLLCLVGARLTAAGFYRKAFKIAKETQWRYLRPERWERPARH